MPELRGEERWAAAMIAAALGAEVLQHDDGSRPGMHDLDLVLDGGRTAAVEVTAAADPDSIELWKLINDSDERWIVPYLSGGWTVSLLPTARAKRLVTELPVLLRQLEALEVERFGFERQEGEPVTALLRELGVAHGSRGSTSFPGVIYATIELRADRRGGFVSNSPETLNQWVPTFLTEPQQADVLAKLARSGADQRHVFIVVPAFTTAPFGVSDMLWRERGPLPPVAPALPAEVTHVWLASAWKGGSGVRWSPQAGWQRFNSLVN